MSLLLKVIIGLVIFWAIVLLLDRLYDLESRGVTVEPGSLIWRTERGLGLIDRISKLSKRFWNVFGVLGVVAGSILMILSFLKIAGSAVGVLESYLAPAGGGSAMPGVMPIVPGWTLPLDLLVPVLIALGTVLLVHEPAHGIVARKADISLESTGLMIFAVIPGAFVEPDEDELDSASILNRLQVYGAGSFANIIFGFAILILMLSLISPLPGLYVSGVFESTPAGESIQPGSRILSVGFSDHEMQQVSNLEDFNSFLEGTRPGDQVIIETSAGVSYLTLTEYPSGENLTFITEEDNMVVDFPEDGENKGFVGVRAYLHSLPAPKYLGSLAVNLFSFQVSPTGSMGLTIAPYLYNYRVPASIIQILFWIFLVNIGVGIFNLLPLKPLDGGHILEGLAEKITSEEWAKYVSMTVSAVTLFVVLVNFVPWILP